MQISIEEQELLEQLWEDAEADQETSIEDLGAPEVVQQLVEKGCIRTDDGRATLTESGAQRAQQAIRRHRLAERLLADIIAVKPPRLEETSCEFEHVLHTGIADRVCTLLGHPRQCPHGRPIPEGKCCREGERNQEVLVSRLVHLASGASGTVAYLSDCNGGTINQLTSLGILPGAKIRLERTSPAFVIRSGECQLAVDRETAETIFVRLASDT